MLFPHICSFLTSSFYNICKKTADVRIAPYLLSLIFQESSYALSAFMICLLHFIQLSYWRIAISLWIGCPCPENFSSYSVITFAMLRCGAEIYRVEDSVIRILEAFGLDDFDAYVLSNGIFASANESREDACSVVRYVPPGKFLLRTAASRPRFLLPV